MLNSTFMKLQSSNHFFYCSSLSRITKSKANPCYLLGYQGRNITVKLADTNKNKLVQLPLPMPFASQPGQVHVSTPPVGYVYPQPGGTYPSNAYPVPQVQTPSYGHVAVKNDGIGGYPYYVAKQ